MATAVIRDLSLKQLVLSQPRMKRSLSIFTAPEGASLSILAVVMDVTLRHFACRVSRRSESIWFLIDVLNR
jgi:hypothetical protein